MQKWEYEVLHIPNMVNLENMLNDMGRAGWELVGIESRYELFIFKRPIP